MDSLAAGITATTRVARDQDGLVTRTDLAANRVSRRTSAKMLRIGHLHRVLPGIYVVGADWLTRRQLLRTATLMAPGRTWLSARSGLEVRSVLWAKKSPATVFSTASRADLRVDHVLLPVDDGSPGVIHTYPLVRSPPSDFVEGLPTTSVPRSLVDLARCEGRRMLEIAWSQAEYRGLLIPTDLEREVDGPRRTGVEELARLVKRRRILTTPDTDLRSPKELPFLHLIAAAGLPLPEVNVPMRINGKDYVADFYWRLLRLVLELDSADHLKEEAGVRDRVRDTDFFIEEIDVVRFVDVEALAKPDEYLETLRAVIERQQKRMPLAA